jgi:integrase
MAVTNYKSDTGEMLFKVSVNIRSKVTDGLRIQKTKFGIKNLKLAEREENALIRECQTELSKREAQGSSWGAVVEAWADFLKVSAHNLAATTRSDYVASIKKHTSSWWNKQAVEISKADIYQLFSDMNHNGFTNSYQRKMKTLIHRAFIFGIEQELIRGMNQSPTVGIKLGRKEDKKPEILNNTQIRHLLKSAKDLDHPWYPVWAMAVLTGMRNGELFALLWTDVDLETKKIRLDKSYNCRKRITKETKGGYWRNLPISDELSSLLLDLKATSGTRNEVLPRVTRWGHGVQARELRKFCIGIGLPSIKFHTLRACFATQLIHYGVPPIQIQKICGWKDLETMQRYVRIAGIETDGVTECLRVLPEHEIFKQVAAVFPGKSAQDVEGERKALIA